MNFDELQKQWQSQSGGFKLRINADILLKEVQRNKENFESSIFWRDVREAGGSIVMAPVISYLALRYNLPMLHFLALACIFVAAFIIIDRIIQKKKFPRPNESLAGCVAISLAQMQHQIWLIKNVFWWYLLPFVIGISLFWGDVAWQMHNWAGLTFIGGCFVGLFILYTGVYYLNQYAVRKVLIPRKQELEELLKSIKDNNMPSIPDQKANMPKKKNWLIMLISLIALSAISAWLIAQYSFNEPAPLSLDSIPVKGLYIVDAKYGAGKKWVNVSNELRKQIHNDTLSIEASNEIRRDPAFGMSKSLQVEYVLDGRHETTEVQEGQWLHIPPDVNRHPELKPAATVDELMALVKNCPAEIGFYGKNLSTGQTVEYKPDQPACLASMVKIFVLLEVMRQADKGTLDLSEPITIQRKDKKETCTISQALDKMIGVSDNEATGALAVRVGYDRVNALPDELQIAGLSKKILPEPDVLGEVLDKRVWGDKEPGSFEILRDQRHLKPNALATTLLPQHGTARGIARYYELLSEKKLISETISERVLEVFDRNPKKVAPTATPVGFKSIGKGGSLAWFRPAAQPYNMVGWGALIRNEDTAVVFCLWFEWFPESTSEELKSKWCYTVSDSIVNVLLSRNRN